MLAHAALRQFVLQREISNQLCFVWERASLEFGVLQVVIYGHIENSLSFRYQFYTNPQGFFNLCSQTDRLRFVVSLCAIGDGDIHWGLLSVNALDASALLFFMDYS
ncbi:MAG: hypothetical protein ACI9ON_001979 [Limisphaerales bacterium]|jgi:hypothetical protein